MCFHQFLSLCLMSLSFLAYLLDRAFALACQIQAGHGDSQIARVLGEQGLCSPRPRVAPRAIRTASLTRPWLRSSAGLRQFSFDGGDLGDDARAALPQLHVVRNERDHQAVHDVAPAGHDQRREHAERGFLGRPGIEPCRAGDDFRPAVERRIGSAPLPAAAGYPASWRCRRSAPRPHRRAQQGHGEGGRPLAATPITTSAGPIP